MLSPSIFGEFNNLLIEIRLSSQPINQFVTLTSTEFLKVIRNPKISHSIIQYALKNLRPDASIVSADAQNDQQFHTSSSQLALTRLF
jgi:hypothetical protein